MCFVRSILMINFSSPCAAVLPGLSRFWMVLASYRWSPVRRPGSFCYSFVFSAINHKKNTFKRTSLFMEMSHHPSGWFQNARWRHMETLKSSCSTIGPSLKDSWQVASETSIQRGSIWRAAPLISGPHLFQTLNLHQKFFLILATRKSWRPLLHLLRWNRMRSEVHKPQPSFVSPYRLRQSNFASENSAKFRN